MGTKAHDFLLSHYVENITMNCIVTCHGGEEEHGTQIELWFRFIDHSLSIGAIS